MKKLYCSSHLVSRTHVDVVLPLLLFLDYRLVDRCDQRSSLHDVSVLANYGQQERVFVPDRQEEHVTREVL